MNTPTQNFTSKNLRWMRRRGKQFHLSPKNVDYPRTEAEWDAILERIEQEISCDSISFDHLRTAHINRSGKSHTIAFTKSLEETLVLRKINENIRRAYGIRSRSRSDAVKIVQQAVTENTPKALYRLDIKACFESIDREAAILALEQDGKISYQTINLLKKVMTAAYLLKPKLSKRGLPRGLITSGTIAEIYLSKIEREIQNISGVYLVTRYVDDFAIFATIHPNTLVSCVDEILTNSQLSKNIKKSNAWLFACLCENGCTHGNQCPCKKSCKCASLNDDAKINVEYLGYKIVVPQFNSGNANKIATLLSESKTKKIKTRIHLSIKSYLALGNDELLLARLKYITSNQLLKINGKKGLFNGLSYTHTQYTENSSDEPGSLIHLDQFLQTRLRVAMRTRPSQIKNELIKISFSSGFEHKRRTTFTAQEVKLISAAWKNG